MRYIVNTITDLIKKHEPSEKEEMMIRINGFEDVNIYEQLANRLSAYYEKTTLSIDLKLARKKWLSFKESQRDLAALQILEQNGWVAEQESITYYRNLHRSNILVLMGTEEEEDKGGLMNCFTITPSSLTEQLKGKYAEIFANELQYLSEEEKGIINKLYKQLFEFEAVDICKLSNIADRWKDKITTIEDFEKLFFASLAEWGLPVRYEELPSVKALSGRKNVLRGAHKFITRNMFVRMSQKQYEKYKKQIEIYATEGKYGSAWEGWKNQGFYSYEEFATAMSGFMIGAQVEENRQKFLKTDFAIIDDVLQKKATGPVDEKEKKQGCITLTGEPLEIFLKSILYTLREGREREKEGLVEIHKISIDVKSAEIVGMYSDLGNDDQEEKQNRLLESWKNICCHTNGVVEYIAGKGWKVNEKDIEITLIEPDFFSVSKAVENIEDEKIKFAAANKILNKIQFTIYCCDVEGNKIRGLKQDYQWQFQQNIEWIHNFMELCQLEDEVLGGEGYLPLATIQKINPLLFTKSEEEFFDQYDESNIDLSEDLMEYIRQQNEQSQDSYTEKFRDLAIKFESFVEELRCEGFYKGIKSEDPKLQQVVDSYSELGRYLISKSIPENMAGVLNAYIHAFNIESNTAAVCKGAETQACIVPPWHPSTLQKIYEQKKFIVDGCWEWWNESLNAQRAASKKAIDNMIEQLLQMSMIQSSVDVFPTSNGQYYGVLGSYGAFSIYGRDDIENDARLKDSIQKDAIFDDDFDQKEIYRMTDNAKMIFGGIAQYVKAFPSASNNLVLVFINPSELQPIIAAVYHYIELLKKKNEEEIHIQLKILVKPENKGGRNYLAYWMDEFFSQNENVNIKVYLNVWEKKSELEKLLNGNNDLIFVMDLLKIKNFQFIRDTNGMGTAEKCKFPIVYKPSPSSSTSVNRKIELSQPQFEAAYIHTQVVHYKDTYLERVPDQKYVAVREVCIDDEGQEIVYALHNKAYWVICIDSGMDGALLRLDQERHSEYSIIGFSTGKGAYGQYNLTVTTRQSILNTIKKRFENRLADLFLWERDKIKEAADTCMLEATGLDGISLLSAINPSDYNINEFMAYVLTSYREKEKESSSALKVVIHLDSYKHWFQEELDEREDEDKTRPDFLILQTVQEEDEKLHLKATVVECKTASIGNAEQHREKAFKQVKNGIEVLSELFDPNSNSIKKRYWYAQLYRALTFSQVTFSNNTDDFQEMAAKLRCILDGRFEIEWSGEILGYWFDMEGTNEEQTELTDQIDLFDIPQERIQKLLTQGKDTAFVEIREDLLEEDQKQKDLIQEREDEITAEIAAVMTKEVQYDEIDIVEEVVQKEAIEKLTEQIEERSKDLSEEDQNKNIDPEEAEMVSENDPTKEEDKMSQKSLEEIRVLIGKDRAQNDIYWEFGNPKLANRHLLITGMSGQGKTYSMQTMLYELSKYNVPAVIFDNTESFRLDQLERPFVEAMGNKLRQHIVYWEGVPINPFKRHEIEIAGMVMQEKSSDVAARIAEILKHVYKFGDQQYAAIYEAARSGLEKYGEQMNMSCFEEELEILKESNPAAKTVASKMTPFFHSVEFKEVEEFDWENILYSEEAQTNVIQLTSINREMQLVIIELMLWDAWYYTKKYGSKDKPFVVVLDEAQNLSHKDSSPSKAILTEGRKFGWSGWFATQSLKVLADDEIVRLMQAAFKLNFKPTEQEVMKIAKQLDAVNGNNWIGALQGLEKGQCIIAGDRIRPDGTFGSTKPTITRISSFEDRQK